MKASYKAGIKEQQKLLIEDKPVKSLIAIEDIFLKSLLFLNTKEQVAHKFLYHCKIVSSEMPSVQPQEEVTARNALVRYQEFDVAEDDLKLRIDLFWHEIFSKSRSQWIPFCDTAKNG